MFYRRKKQTGKLDNFSRIKESWELWKEKETNELRTKKKVGRKICEMEYNR